MLKFVLEVKKVPDWMRGLDFNLVEVSFTRASLSFHYEEGEKQVLFPAIRIAGDL